MNQETNQDVDVEVGVNIFQNYCYNVAYIYQSHFNFMSQKSL